jgi:hypothetical protein
MGWERGYYYRVRKVGGRVVREYCGKGEIANGAALIDAKQGMLRRQKAEEWKRTRATIEARDMRLKELCEVVDLLARAALLGAGFHQHHRGEWRRKHERCR